MTYLSQLKLDMRSRGYRSDVENPYGMHATLARCINGSDGRVLWRIEGMHGVTASVLVQHAGEIDAATLLERGGNLVPGIETLLLNDDRIVVGGIHRFRLIANPTITKAGKRLGAVGMETQYAWLGRQAASNGFEVLGALVHGEQAIRARPLQQSRAPIEFLQVTFEGHLRVTDRDQFLKGMHSGIGHAKAFGCGLLTIDGLYCRP